MVGVRTKPPQDVPMQSVGGLKEAIDALEKFINHENISCNDFCMCMKLRVVLKFF